MKELKISREEFKELFIKGEVIVKGTKLVCRSPVEYGKTFGILKDVIKLEEIRKYQESLYMREVNPNADKVMVIGTALRECEDCQKDKVCYDVRREINGKTKAGYYCLDCAKTRFHVDVRKLLEEKN